MSILSSLARENKRETGGGGAPFAAGSAVNGTSLDAGGRVVLGQQVGAVGDPAQLLDNREIPFNNFLMQWINGAGRFANFDPLTRLYQLGDIDNIANGTVLTIAEFINTLLVSDALENYLSIDGANKFFNFGSTAQALQIDAFNSKALLGDVADVGNGWKVSTDDNGQFASMGDLNGVSSGVLFDLFESGGFGIFEMFDNVGTYLDINGNTNIYQFGDTNSSGNGSMLRVRDNLSLVEIGDPANASNNFHFDVDNANQKARFLSAPNFAFMLDLDWLNRLYRIGEFDNGADYDLEIDQVNDLARILLNNSSFFTLDRGNQIFEFGDISGVFNGSKMIITDNLQLIELRAGGNTNLFLDDVNQNYKIGDVGNIFGAVMLQMTGGKIQSKNTGEMVGSLTGYTNNAGAAGGTLLNAPAAGNPTKWIPIDDNGTIRNIPAW